jgi:hypothetical protein
VDVEVRHTGLRFYEHAQFTSGITARGTLIGLPLGPRGNAVAARVGWAGAAGDLGFAAVLERRSEDQYVTTVTGADDSGWRFVKTEDRPEESRVRFTASWSQRRGSAPGLEVEAGAERSLNHGFVAGADRTNLVARIRLVAGF